MIDSSDRISSWPARWSWFFFAAMAIVGDLIIRHEIVLAWSQSEKNQYLVSIFISFLFWYGFFGVACWLRDQRAGRIILPLWLASGATLLWMPISVFFHYGTYPTRDGFLFFANQLGFAVESLSFITHPRDIMLYVAILATIAGFAKMQKPMRGFRSWQIHVLLIGLAIGINGWANIKPSIPLTPEGNSVRLIAKVAQWRSNPPEFFSLSERYVQSNTATINPKKNVNVLWIVGETLGARYLNYNPMPNLARFMARSDVVALSNLHSNASCTDLSVPSILSGKSPATSVAEYKKTLLPADFFGPADFRTFLFSSHALEWGNLRHFFQNENLHIMEGAEEVDPAASLNSGIDDAIPSRKAIELIRQSVATDQRFMGILHLNTTHPPYTIDENHQPFTDENTRHEFGPAFVRYLNSMANFDRKLSDFLTTIEEDGRFQDTLIIFTADHGEAFGQHGISSHCGKFYGEETHIPGFLVLPESLKIDPGKLSRLMEAKDQFRMNVDLLPTVLDLMGIDPEPFQLAGQPLTQEPSVDTIYHFSNCSEYRRCPIRHFGIYRNKIKFLYHADKNRWEAFDTTKDPEDTIDVIDLHRAELEAIMPIIRLNPTFRKLLERG